MQKSISIWILIIPALSIPPAPAVGQDTGQGVPSAEAASDAAPIAVTPDAGGKDWQETTLLPDRGIEA